MPNRHGDFIWYELLTDDIGGAQAFYRKVVGWQVEAGLQPGVDYRLLSMPSGEPVIHVGGMMQLTEAMKAGGARPIWLGYIAVDNVDTSVAAIIAAGGQLQMPATDVPDVGRIAMVTDPQGIPFYVMRGASDAISLAFAQDKPRPGHCAWNELRTSDQSAGLAFYCDQFHWQKDGEMDMGAMGRYEFLRHGGVIGAVMTNPDPAARPRWNYYFRVVDIDRAADAITVNGGRVTQGPDAIPGGDFALNALDPQGASFALVGSRS